MVIQCGMSRRSTICRKEGCISRASSKPTPVQTTPRWRSTWSGRPPCGPTRSTPPCPCSSPPSSSTWHPYLLSISSTQGKSKLCFPPVSWEKGLDVTFCVMHVCICLPPPPVLLAKHYYSISIKWMYGSLCLHSYIGRTLWLIKLVEYVDLFKKS